MSSLLQIESNRRNAQKSTGPRSAEGKAASRFNALKTGIHAKSHVIPGEDPDDLDRLVAEYFDLHRPANATERFLVESLIHAEWQLQRLHRAKAQLWDNHFAGARNSRAYPLNENAPLGDVFDRNRNSFLLLQRLIDSTDRTYHRALAQLERLRASRAPEPPEPDPKRREPEPQPLENKPPSSDWVGSVTVPPPEAPPPDAPLPTPPAR